MNYKIRTNKAKKNIKSLGIANAFSGGIFLSISLLHLLPEVIDINYFY